MAKATFDGELMFPGAYLAAAELHGKDTDVTIEHIERTKLKTKDGMKEKWIIHFKELDKPYVWNTTNGQTVGALPGYGTEARGWFGKRITLFPTTCLSFGVPNTPCIRVRDKVPKDAGSKPAATKKTEAPKPDEGKAAVLGQIRSALLEKWPTASDQDKAAKKKIVEVTYAAEKWSDLEAMNQTDLEAGYAGMMALLGDEAALDKVLSGESDDDGMP